MTNYHAKPQRATSRNSWSRSKFVFPQDREALVATISSPLESAIERGLVDAAEAIELLEVCLILGGRADADSLSASRSESEG
jgi:hypothetical protein